MPVLVIYVRKANAGKFGDYPVVDRLRGMYAFVIWDTKKKRLFGARDIFGIKPFYYAQMNQTFLFASEIKAFMEHPKFDNAFNYKHLKALKS